MWMWARTRQALRQDSQPESVECSVIHHASAELRSADGGSGNPPTRCDPADGYSLPDLGCAVGLLPVQHAVIRPARTNVTQSVPIACLERTHPREAELPGASGK